MPGNTLVIIDGRDFSTLEEFFQVFGRHWLGTGYDGAGGNLDWFNDILWWPAGEEGGRYTLVWRNANESRQRLGYGETVRQLEQRGVKRFPNEFTCRAVSDLNQARLGRGPTVFDWLLEIIEDNRECVELRLE
jgi:hypothetical protein